MNKFEVLKQYFGYEVFRPGQETIIDGIMAGNDALTIMPTGGGKSICYQIPSLLLGGTNIVVSPLISLMKDQVSALTQVGIQAAYINSSLSAEEVQMTYTLAKDGHYTLLYVAPEQLLTDRFQQLTSYLDIKLVSIDEAHCVSQWGQDFRPHYLDIATFVASLPSRPRVAAFTATATEFVCQDIESRLSLSNALKTTTGFNRANLYYKVLQLTSREKYPFVKDYVMKHRNDAGIIYCQTRKEVESVAAQLQQDGYKVGIYHGGMDSDGRNANQERFIRDEVSIMVATNAFGMGIDKSNVAFVIHHNMPKNIESYYQEAGRAGRDGAPAECILLFSGSDVRTNNFFIDNASRDERTDEKSFQDFQTYERQRLRQMTTYAKTKTCLRTFILEYFGDTNSVTCDNCYNCQSEFIESDITEDAQKILSCVYRMDQRYGMIRVIEVLRGSKNKVLLAANLDRITTYGILSSRRKETLQEIIETLVEMEYLSISDDSYSVLKLTAEALPVLKGDAKIIMRTLKTKPVTQLRQTRMHVENEALFETLRTLRLTIARERNVPAYTVFSDLTLKDMCHKLPQTPEAFLNVDGVGSVKMEAFGAVFIQAINTYIHEERQ
ncbi:DNA helicase RecQ [Erysipelothrix sp. HDW6C]|uniref:DNA helicase RecQ n=1 Tax=Erysipelothrix sp. HDW6C TaxID=2714930 RepID=UPI0014086E3A|nr:DNA helicase RecQ [Erysipelothrix sp. HDW6C]QIK70316.1 DNA helicase RecQ [Erysipelothrix sp. HDW6C]